jgi:mannosyltransferase
LLIASSRQREQVAWLPRPDFHQLTAFLTAEYATSIFVIAVLLIAIVGLGRGTHAPALGLGLAWALLPTVTLWTVSQAHPLFDWRYAFFTVPGTALALASIATLLRWRWLVAVVAAVAIGGLHMQNVYRYSASGHGENIRGVAQVIADKAQPGDAVLFLPASRRVVELAYPDDFRGVDDIALAGSGEQTATLWGVERPADEIRAELRKRNRIWVVTGAKRTGELFSDPGDQEKEEILYNGYRMAGVVFVNRYEVRLYVHDPLPIVPASGTSS